MTEQNLATIAAKPPIVVMRERLEQRTTEIRAALVDIRPEQFIRAVITSATINPDIQACSWQSLWLACMRACRDDLLPDGRQGAIVPYKDKATWIPMYQGLLLRAWRTGKFKWIGADIVREGDRWEHYVDTSGVHFRHEPGDDIDRPILRIYAAATTLDGGTFLAVLPFAEANKIKRMSKTTRDDSPWKMWESEMFKKTALRRLAKMLPIEITVDEDADEPFEEPQPIEATPRRAPGALAALDAFAGGGREDVEESSTASGSGQFTEAEREQAKVELQNIAAGSGESPETFLERSHREAYQRGKDDKAKGVARKAVPTEYRDVPKLALAWVAGWSGEQFTPARSDNAESK